MRSADEAAAMEKVKYLQKAFGYALTGNTRYECLFILYGATTRNVIRPEEKSVRSVI